MSLFKNVYRPMLMSTGIYSVAVVAGRMSSFLLMPIYTRFLTISDWGVLELLELTMYVFGTLVGMRLGDALLFYASKEPAGSAEQKELVQTGFWGSLLVSAGFFVVGYWAAPFLSELVFGSEAYGFAFRLMFGAFLFSLPQEIGLAYMRSENRADHYVLASIVRLLLSGAINITLLAGFRMGLEGMLYGGVLTSVLMAAGFAVYCLRNSGPPAFRPELFKRLIAFGAPLGIGGLGLLVIHYGDRAFLKHYGLGVVGLYSFAYKIGMLVANVQTPFDIYWRSQMFAIMKRPEGDRIYVRVCTYLTLVLTTLAVLLAVLSTPALELLFQKSFADAGVYVPWVALAYVIRAIGSHLRSAFLLEGKPAQESRVVWAGTVGCLILYWVLIPRYAMWGAIAATVAAFTIMLIVGYYQAQRVRRFEFEYGRIGVIMASGAVAWSLSYFCPFESLGGRFFWGLFLAVLYGALIWLSGFLTAEERKLLSEVRARVQQSIYPGPA